MNIPSHLKLLSVFLVGAATATAIFLPIALTHEPSRDLSAPTTPARPNGLPKSSSINSSASVDSDRVASSKQEESTPHQGSDRGPVPADGANIGTSNPAASHLAPVAPSRSAFATSSAAIDAPTALNRSVSTSSSAGSTSGNSYSAPEASSMSSEPGSNASASAPYGASYGSSQAPAGSYGYSAPVQGGSGAAPTSSTIEIGPAATIPASLAQPNPAAKLTPEEQSLAQDLGKQFLDTVGNASPSDPAAADTWDKAQRQNDALYKLYFGYQAYNTQSASAYRDSIQSSGTSQ